MTNTTVSSIILALIASFLIWSFGKTLLHYYRDVLTNPFLKDEIDKEIDDLVD